MSSSSLLKKVSPHEKKLRKFFRQFELPADAKPVRQPVAILLFMNRSGSSLIAEYLRATGRFSGFGEPLNYDLVIERAREQGLDTFQGYLEWLLENVHQADTLFGMKASLDQVLMLYRAGVLPRYLPNVKWAIVQRVDILSQAISLSIAEQTQKWQSYKEGNGTEPQYSFKTILDHIQTISDTYAASLMFLSVAGITPHFVTYEQFLEDPRAETARLASFLGQDGVYVNARKLRMEKQASEINQEFRTRFLQDFRTGG